MAPRRPIYLDHQATTPVDPRVLDAMRPYFEDEFGNAASKSHVYGWRAEAAVEEARERIAELLGVRSREIVFTSGATESNNLAILGGYRGRKSHRRGVLTLATEHHAVLDPARALIREDAECSVLPVGPDGLVELGHLAESIGPKLALVSVMAANNEIGVLQPLEEIGRLCREHGVWFHTDAAQAIGKVPLDLEAAGIDLLSISGHKLYGPKGVGVLYVRSSRPRVKLEPLQYGGGHERGLRSGTLPVPLIVGLAKAMEIASAEGAQEALRLGQLRERLWSHLSRELEGVHLNGHPEHRLPGNLNVSFEGVDGDSLLLSLKRIAVSSGSACTSATPEPSHVLAALGVPERLARASLRFGLGRSTRAEEIDEAAEIVVESVLQLRGARAASATAL